MSRLANLQSDMKTKYILHGGYTNEDNESNRSFFAEMVNSVPDGGNILLVYFASEKDDIEQKYRKDATRLQSFSAGKQIKTTIATEDNFINEIKDADVIYLRGGDTQKLKATLESHSDFLESIKGKTVSGSSAGAYVLSKYYFSNSHNRVMEGYGYVPARVACHYKSTTHPVPIDTDPVSELGKYDNDLELILLKDYEWVIREIENGF